MGQGSNLGYVLLFVMLTIPGHVYELFPVRCWRYDFALVDGAVGS
jgi:hypothetical protein